MGFRQGDLIVKGDGSTPVILAPNKPVVDWTRYEAVDIDMYAEGGREIKIKIGNDSYAQPIGQLRKLLRYHFTVSVPDPGPRPLAIMPTDGLYDLVAIRAIRLVPRKADFGKGHGRDFIGKRDEFRNVIFTHSPATLSYEVAVPTGGRLVLGMGNTEAKAPVTFRVVADGTTELLKRTVTDIHQWEDAGIDLSAYSGRKVKLEFETSSPRAGTVALWANPTLTTREPKARVNVLVYLIDTMRADHTSLHGYARDTTPFLKKLGAEGLVFEDCQVQATWTKPSVASMLTSLYSYTHGMVDDYDTIPPGAATLAGQMRAAGYVTAAVMANPFTGRISGLQRGFDFLDEWNVIQRYRTDKEDRGTDSAAVNKIVFPWLEQHKDEPFFLYAHTTDPHAPYRPPAGFEEKWANPAETPAFDRAFKSMTGVGQYGGGAVVSRAGAKKAGVDPETYHRQSVERYDGEIAFNDANLEKLIGKLRELGVLDNTLVIVVSDHGEEFWEHGWTAHGHSLYQELAHGVFVMWGPKLIGRPRRVAEPVQLVDVMPTVLDLVGAPMPEMVQGQSLAPLVRGQAFHRRGPVVSSRFASPHAQGYVPENGTGTFAMMDANWKLLFRDKAKKTGMKEVELYDHRHDPTESRDVAAEHPQQVELIRRELTRWTEAQNRIRATLKAGAKAKIDQKTLQQLRSLGYLGGKQ
jgi:arylsulfatase A-like enzyme